MNENRKPSQVHIQQFCKCWYVLILYKSKWTINNLHGSISTQFNHRLYDYDSIFWRNSVSTVYSILFILYQRARAQPCCVQQRVPSKVGLIKTAKIEGHTQVESTALLEIDHPWPLSKEARFVSHIYPSHIWATTVQRLTVSVHHNHNSLRSTWPTQDSTQPSAHASPLNKKN